MFSITRSSSGTLIVNTDPHNAKWLDILRHPRSYHAYFFDSYSMPFAVSNILNLLRCNCSVWEYKAT